VSVPAKMNKVLEPPELGHCSNDYV